MEDRNKHVYIIGKTGMGKTALLRNMLAQDIRNGFGVGFLDPHGEAAEELLDFVPEERIKDVCYFNPGDINYPMSFNVMEEVSVEQRHLIASGLMEVFKKIWPDVWSARMEYILSNTILALLESPGTTLLGVNRMLADANYRKKIINNVKDPIVKSFWLHEFARYSERYEVEATAAIQNKIGQFISSPLIRNIIGQKKSSINIREAMDKGKILIFNLSKGKVGEDSCNLLGGLIITKIQSAAMSRVDIPESERKNFFLFVDEFQNFATPSFCNIMSEARKYRLNLTIAHQYIAQMEDEIRDAIFGNMGTLISFRVGAEDAEYLEKEFTPEFSAQDLVNLPKYHIYLKLMVNGIASRAFSAETLSPFQPEIKSHKNEIIEYSRKNFTAPREEIEREIAEWTGDFVISATSKSGDKQTKLYDVKCSMCGKDTKVPFEPDPNRPVFCKECLKKKSKEGVSHSQEKKEDESNSKKTEIAGEGEKSKKKENNSEEKGEKKLTLEELLMKQPTPFSSKKKKTRKEKRESIDEEKLKKAVRESLEERDKEAREKETKKKNKEKKETENKNLSGKKAVKYGKIEPGGFVKFD